MHTVCVPIAHMFETPDITSQHTDEVLFGFECEIKDEFGGFYKITTEYNYTGWVKKEDICPRLFTGGFTVKTPFADLLPTPENRRAPIITFPKGARVDYGTPHEGERYGMVILPNKTGGYMHREWVVPNPKKTCDYRNIIAETALSYLGVQYRWGGKTHGGIDCSGLAFMAYHFAGIPIYRDARIELSPALKEIHFDEMAKGDLMFYKGHVAIYLGDERFVHSCGARGVCVSDFNTQPSMKKDIITIGTAK